MSFVVTSCAFKVHRVSGSGRGKPSAIVHIGFLAFHGISLKHTHVRKIAILGLRSLEGVGITHWPPHSLKCQNSCRQIDIQTDTHTDQVL